MKFFIRLLNWIIIISTLFIFVGIIIWLFNSNGWKYSIASFMILIISGIMYKFLDWGFDSILKEKGVAQILLDNWTLMKKYNKVEQLKQTNNEITN